MTSLNQMPKGSMSCLPHVRHVGAIGQCGRQALGLIETAAQWLKHVEACCSVKIKDSNKTVGGYISEKNEMIHQAISGQTQWSMWSQSLLYQHQGVALGFGKQAPPQRLKQADPCRLEKGVLEWSWTSRNWMKTVLHHRCGRQPEVLWRPSLGSCDSWWAEPEKKTRIGSRPCLHFGHLKQLTYSADHQL